MGTQTHAHIYSYTRNTYNVNVRAMHTHGHCQCYSFMYICVVYRGLVYARLSIRIGFNDIRNVWNILMFDRGKEEAPCVRVIFKLMVGTFFELCRCVCVRFVVLV